MRHIVLLFLLALLLAGCTSASDAPALMGDEPVVMSFPSPDYGIHAFLWWKPDTALRDLGLVNDMGFTWVKQKFPWREIEGIEKGQYDWYRTDYIVDETEKAGLKLLVRLDQQPYWAEPADNQWQENGPPGNMADFADFCGAVAPRYRRRIAALCPDDSGAELRHHGLYSLALLRKSEVLKSSGARKSLFTGWPVRYVEQSSFHQP